MKTILSKDTLVPIGALGFLVAVVWWGAYMTATVEGLRSDVDKMQTELEAARSSAILTAEQLARVETKLDFVIDNILDVTP